MPRNETMKASPYRFWHLSYWSQTWVEMPAKDKKILGAIVLLHFVLTAIYIRFQGVIFDEPDYFTYAIAWLKGHPERTEPLMDSKTPLMVVSLVPALFKTFLPDSLMQNDFYFYLKAGRPFMYLYQLIGIGIVYCWSKRLWGGLAWIFPVLFYCFDPLVFSYGMFIGSDMPSASLLVALVYTVWRYTKTRERRYWWRLCVLAAVAVVLKASLIYCYPLLFILFLCNALWQEKPTQWKRVARDTLQFVFIQLLLINLAYYCKGSFTYFQNISFESNLFTWLQAASPFAGHLPVPFPAAFIQGIDMLQHHGETGGGVGPGNTFPGVYIAGAVSMKDPIWYYYLVNALFKWPLLTWLLLTLTVWRVLRRNDRFVQIKSQVYIWLPPLFFLVILSFLNKFQIGIRHSMLLLPFIYIGMGNTCQLLYQKRKWIFTALILLHFCSLAQYWPNMLSYTNELLTKKRYVYRLLRDSSVDYGQSKPLLRKFLAENRQYKKPTNLSDTGYFAITIGDLFTQTEGEINNIAWLRNQFEPVDHYQHSILLYHINAAELKRLQ